MADMFVTGKAGRAGAAMVKRPDDDTLADRDVLNSGTDRRDGARHFMPDDSFKADAGVHIAVEDVHVGAADPAIGDPDGHLAIRRGGRCPRFNGELPVAAIEGGSDRLVGHFVLS